MRRGDLYVAILLLTATAAFFVSCKKDEDKKATPTTVSISDTAQTVSENAGTVSITLTLSQAATQETKINCQLAGTAIFNGDYEVDSAASQMTVAAGGTTATLKLNVFDDPVAEEAKTIEATFSATNLTFNNSKAIVTVNDNDASQAANGLQTDLTWNAGSRVNLDVFVATNVVINSNNEVTGLDLVRSSENEKGFESVLVNNTDPDGDYYLVFLYKTGGRSVDFNFRITTPGGDSGTDSSSFAATDTATALFLGPVTKTGSTYGKLAGGGFDLGNIKTFAYRKKIRL